MKSFKKLACLILALAISFAVTVPAFASRHNGLKPSISYEMYHDPITNELVVYKIYE